MLTETFIEKNHELKPRLRKTNMAHIHLLVNIWYKVKDNQATIHRPRETKKQGELQGALMNIPRKGK